MPACWPETRQHRLTAILTPQRSAPLLRVDRLSVFYGPHQVVTDVSFALDRGKSLAIIGESGSGKSTIVRSVLRLLPYGARATPHVIRQVRQENADLGFVYAPVDDPAVGTEPIMRTAMVCVLPRDHRLAGFAEIGAAQLAEEQVILLDPVNTPGLYLHRRLEELGVRLPRVIETNLAWLRSPLHVSAGICHPLSWPSAS